PGAFSAGLDVPHLLTLDARGVRAAWQGFIDAARALAQSPVPVVAALNGHAPAGGCVLARCGDYRGLAQGDYRIGLNETQVGLVAPEGSQRLMRRVVGPHRAERLLVGGEMVDAERAQAIGLVDELAPIDEVPQRARAWLSQLLALPPRPMLATRAIARVDVVDALRPELLELDRFVAGWNDPDTQSALRALLARIDRKSTRLNSSHVKISYAVFCLKKKTCSIASMRTATDSASDEVSSARIFMPRV